jgi:hypothetical protein
MLSLNGMPAIRVYSGDRIDLAIMVESTMNA